LAPYVAELKPEYKSEWIFVIICIMALVAGLLLKTNKIDEEKEKLKQELIE
jgi:general stress protein CsbA